MALLQISEPGLSAQPHRQRRAIGIDLGTTHSLVASVRSGAPETLPDSEGRHLLPSVVRYARGAAPVVGWEARATMARDPLNTLASVKRFMGRSGADIRARGGRAQYAFAEDAGSVPRIRTDGGDVSAIEVSAEILRVLRRRAEESLGGELAGAVITVPAYFDDAQRQATKDAATLAGLNVFRLLNEPTAAAVAYGLDRGAEGIHVVYDFGGGTFDVSVLRLDRGVFTVLATAGDTALGGDDLDAALAEELLRRAGIPDDADHRTLRGLLRTACAAKEALTERDAVEVRCARPDGSEWAGTLTRAEFEALAEPVVRRTLTPCRRALRDAGVAVEEVLDVVLVGGSTRVPLVRRRVAGLFGREPLADLDPDRVVALGAAIQADTLAGNRPESDLLLLDVIPLSLGLETMNGLVEKVIPRNTTIPAARAQEFTTFKDGQTAMAVHVVQGERDLVSDCRSLARFELRGIPPMAAGAARVEVRFQVDADGLLGVTARELGSGVHAGVEVKPSYGLGDGEIERMLRESMAHAAEDMEARKLREEQVEADRVLEAIEAALAADGEALLSAEERQVIAGVRAALAEVRAGGDAHAIRRGIDALEAASREFVARRMNASVRKAIAGRSVADVAAGH